MKFFFLGLGSIGQRHLKNLHTLGFRDFWAYRMSPGIALFETEFGVKRVSSYEDGLALKPDVVLITNPSAFHVRDATKAVEAECHVFVEKPLASSMDGVSNLTALAHDRERTVFVGYQMRFHPVLIAIKELIDGGTLGQPISAHIEVGQYLPDWHPGEDYKEGYAAREDLGGGVILTLSHELDYAAWLFGTVRSVYCLGGAKGGLGIQAEDVADVMIDFVWGAAATVHLDYLQRPPSRSCKIICEKGKIEWDYFSNAARVTMRESPDAPREIILPKNFERNAMYLDEMKHFLRVVEGKEESRIPLADAVRTLKLALGARESLKTKLPVTVADRIV